MLDSFLADPSELLRKRRRRNPPAIYYTLNHPRWPRSRLAHHDGWDKSLGRVVGSHETAWIKIPAGPGVEPFMFEFFETDWALYMVKLNGCPLSPEERRVWPHLNAEYAGQEIQIGAYTLRRHERPYRKGPATLVAPHLDGEHIVDDNSVYVSTIGSSPYCSITLPDPSLPEYMARARSVSNHRMLYAVDGALPPISDQYERPEGNYLMRIDNSHFIFAGYLIFPARDPNDWRQNMSAISFRKANGMRYFEADD